MSSYDDLNSSGNSRNQIMGVDLMRVGYIGDDISYPAI